jgi:M6 family metalloprotease-like protein
MKTRSILIILLSTIILSIPKLYAVPATPNPITIKQSDGSEITFRLRGDEFFNYKTTLDGYTLIPDESGILTYAQSDVNGNLISTKIKASNIEKRTNKEKRFIEKLTPNQSFNKLNMGRRAMRSADSGTPPQKAYPLTGTPKSLVILVNFSDLNFVTANPQTAYTNLLNEKGYTTNSGTGSARDYFNENSMGVFNPQFDVVGPFTLPSTLDYYGTNNASGGDTNPRQMVIDACTLANNEGGVNFAQYDTDGNGFVDNVFIYYAGYNEAEGAAKNTIWPHRWSLSNSNTRFDGVSVTGYACTSELRSNSGKNMCGIGTFCHEFGHVLGLPDYYATNDSKHQTLSYWHVMDGGPYLNQGRTPPCYSAFDRFFLDWMKPTEIKEAGDYTLSNLGTTNKAYVFTQYGNHNLIGSAPTPAEFFTLENRQNTGWDSYLYGHGMLISHIYFNVSTWQANGPNNDALAMGYDIVEADGIADNATLSSDPFPGSRNIKLYNPILRDGTDIRKPISNIQETSGIISFHFASNIVLSQNLYDFNTVQGFPSPPQSITVSGSKMSNNLIISFKEGSHYEMKKESDPETAWGKTISLVPTNFIVNKTVIQIRYNPTFPSYTQTHTETIVLKSGTSDYSDVIINGHSTRRVYVVPPVANQANALTYAGFVANWESVSDSIGKPAAGYYLTVYSISDGESSLTEGFDTGLTPPNNWSIAVQGTVTSSLYIGAKLPALKFGNTGESVVTEKYELPVTKLSFYVRSMGGNNSGFLVQAQSDNLKWQKVDSILVTGSLKETKTYNFDNSKGYTRFRFIYYCGTGGLTFDDVSVSFSKKIDYIKKEGWLTQTYDSVSNLLPNTEYIYKVRASDKNKKYNYENITDFSNIISSTTLAYPLEKQLLVIPDANGNVKVFFPTLDVTLYVYSLSGRCIKIIVPTRNSITITDLPRSQSYIFEANGRKAKIAI